MRVLRHLLWHDWREHCGLAIGIAQAERPPETSMRFVMEIMRKAGLGKLADGTAG